jgi:predicted alpha/beta superfamily hydrolase
MNTAMLMIGAMTVTAAVPGLEYVAPLQHGRVYSMESAVLGATTRVTIGLPGSYCTSDMRYPLLLVLDGDLYFDMAYSAVSALSGCGGMPEVIVVGLETDDPVGYYTPTNAPVPDGTPMPSSGMGPLYLDHIERELIPAMADSFRTEPCEILFGHSMAGLFTVYSMLQGRETIDFFVASSPSLWWDDELLTGMIPGWEHREEAGRTRIYLSMGNEGETMLPPALRFADALSARPDVDCFFEQFPRTCHQFAPFKAFAGGIEFIFSPWRIDAPLEELRLEDIEGHYRSLSEMFGYEITIPESLLNSLGYAAMRRGDMAQALEAFRTNMALHPGSSNVYDSLGECLLQTGDTTGARENYGRSLELNPGNSNAAAILEALERE